MSSSDKILSTVFKVDGKSFEVTQSHENNSFVEKHSWEQLRLKVRNYDRDGMPYTHINAIVEYLYPSGRTKWSSATAIIPLHQARKLGELLIALSDEA